MRDQVRGVVICPVCSHIQPPGEECQFCGAHLHPRKPGGIGKSFSYSLGAFAFLIPANLLPMMEVIKLGKVYGNTIIGGVLAFFEHRDYFIGIVIFVASILIPFLKLGILWFLLAIAHFKALRRCRLLGIRLYQFISFIGKYSMLDVFVVVLMVSFIQFGEFVSIKAGPAVVPFSLSVIFTILATEAFDSKLLWDRS
ncbi:MAG: paraquat-inducible protein A [Campylobacterales bacterium]